MVTSKYGNWLEFLVQNLCNEISDIDAKFYLGYLWFDVIFSGNAALCKTSCISIAIVEKGKI
jgi:hypothetical protein